MEQIISADAARAYLHISKRKFLFMLQNGYIRYEDNGNKTHRYSLRMCDVQALRQEMTDHPERFADLNGRFTAQRNKPPTPTVVLSQEEAKELREYIVKQWAKHPDALPSKLAAELTAYENFVRPHRSYLVNMDHIQSISYRGLQLTDQTEIPIPHGKFSEIKERYLEHVFSRKQVFL